MLAQNSIVRRRLEQLDRTFDGQLVRGDVLGDAGALVGVALATLQVGAVATHASHDLDAVGTLAERDRVDLACVDLTEQVAVDHALQAQTVDLSGGGLHAEVEPGEPGLHVGRAGRDVVELLLHPGRERVVHQRGEVLLQQCHHGEGGEARHQSRALLPHVAAVLHGRDDRRIRRGSTDAEILEALDERRLGEACRRLCLVTGRIECVRNDSVACGHLRQDTLLVLERFVRIIGSLDVRTQEPGELDGAAGRSEHRIAGVAGRRRQADLHRLAACVGHLRRNRALPDQFVQAQLGGIELPLDLVRRAETVACRADRLVRLLGVLDLVGVVARSVGQVVLAVLLQDLRTGRIQSRLRQTRGVGTHVGDEAVLVQTLRGGHRLRRGHAQLAAGLLLQRRGHERRRRLACVRLGFDGAHGHRALGERVTHGHRGRLVEEDRALVGRCGQRAVLAEVLARGEFLTGQFDERSGELRLVLGGLLVTEGGLQIPPRRDPERHALTFTLHHDTGRDGLHTPGGQPRHDLLPQHRRDLVAVEPVEDATGLLGIDEASVELTRVVDRVADRLGRDLVEDHALDGHLRVQDLEQVPRDGLSLTILIRREIELVGILQQLLQMADVVLLLGADDVERLEVVLGVDTESRPRFALVLLGNICCVARQIPDVPDRRLDLVLVAEIARDRACFGWRLDDDQGASHE